MGTWTQTANHLQNVKHENKPNSQAKLEFVSLLRTDQVMTVNTPSPKHLTSGSAKDVFLIVDDDQHILDPLCKILEGLNCDVVQATNVTQAREAVQQYGNLSAILCDQRLPDGAGLDFFRDIKTTHPNIIRILITGFVEMQIALAAINEGEIFRFITKPFRREELAAVVKQVVERSHLIRENQKLQADLVAGNAQLQATNVLLKKALSGSVTLCLEILGRFDHVLASHSSRVAKWAVAIGNTLSLSSVQLETLKTAAQLHDMGLISVPRSIHRHQQMGWEDLPSPQQAVIRAHPKQGADLVHFLPNKEIAEIIMAHHEWFNGQGYPRGIAVTRIPFLASIIAVPDAYDEIQMDRAYAAAFVKENLGGRFHPEVGPAFFRVLADNPGYAKEEREVLVAELQAGMKLTCDLFSSSGVLLLPEGQVFTPKLVHYIRQHNETDPLIQRIFVES